jgi:hypothetical protein
MKTYLFLATILFSCISIFSEIKSQELSVDQQIFCKFVYSVFSDKKVNSFISSNEYCDDIDINKNGIYFLSDKTPFCCDQHYDIDYQNMSFHFYRDVDLFFYAIKCPVIIDSLDIQEASGILNLSVYKCRENNLNECLKCSYYFQLRNDKWRIKKKKIQGFKM